MGERFRRGWSSDCWGLNRSWDWWRWGLVGLSWVLGFGFRIVAWVGNSRNGGWGLDLIKDEDLGLKILGKFGGFRVLGFELIGGICICGRWARGDLLGMCEVVVRVF